MTQPTVGAEVQLLRHGPLHGPGVCALIVCGLMMCYAALDWAGMWCVCVIEDLVLFIYSIQLGRKFHWQLGLYVLHLTGTRTPSQVLAQSVLR